MLHTLYWRKPKASHAQAAVASQEGKDYTYTELGESLQSVAPPGYLRIQRRAVLGQGDEAFARACVAMEQLEMFKLGWTCPGLPETSIEEGAPMVVFGSGYGFWSLNVGRILYAERKEDQARRWFSFGFGTLPHHIMAGEERFTVAQELDTGEVWFEIFSFSKAVRLDSWLTLPLIRPMQQNFGRDAVLAMQKFVA